jgi:PAS domain S-box-containing protein
MALFRQLLPGMLRCNARARRLRVGSCREAWPTKQMMNSPPRDAAPRRPRRGAPATTRAGASERRDDAGQAHVLSEPQFLRFAESSDDVFWLADLRSGRLLYASPRFEALWGVDAQHLMRSPELWNDAVMPEDAALLPRPFFADDPCEETVREYRIRGHDGQVHWIRDRRFHLRDDDDDVRCIGGIAEDVTERKQREIDLAALLQRERDARAEAEAATQAKDEFLAVVTHELRSPLNAIRGWSHVLRHSGELGSSQIKALDAIDRNTLAQAHLVDDLLDSQRILCGKLQLQTGRVPLGTLVEEAVEAVRPQALAKRIRLDTAHDPAIALVTADADRLRQAMLKLLSNAIKFTPEDGIVSVRTRRTADTIGIDVQDTGVGMEPAQLPAVFGAFQQADSSSTRRASGLGLGLSLARQLVELHGGRIVARSEGMGRGATFSIELPASAACDDVSPEAPSTAPEGLAGKRIVLVEDDDDGREVLGLILRGAQVELHSFARAASAYDYLAHTPADQQPDALISDIAMPDEDGYAFIRRVRRLEGEEHRPHMMALALTSFARVEDRLRALKAGFDEHVAKPIDPESVLRTLADVLELPDSRPAPA